MFCAAAMLLLIKLALGAYQNRSPLERVCNQSTSELAGLEASVFNVTREGQRLYFTYCLTFVNRYQWAIGCNTQAFCIFWDSNGQRLTEIPRVRLFLSQEFQIGKTNTFQQRCAVTCPVRAQSFAVAFGASGLVTWSLGIPLLGFNDNERRPCAAEHLPDEGAVIPSYVEVLGTKRVQVAIAASGPTKIQRGSIIRRTHTPTGPPPAAPQPDTTDRYPSQPRRLGDRGRTKRRSATAAVAHGLGHAGLA
jgi:hypothetical protein